MSPHNNGKIKECFYSVRFSNKFIFILKEK